MSRSEPIESILERQVRSWELRRRLAEAGGEASTEAMAHVPEGPWITVSSPLGSGGLELAHALAGELGWQVFDRQILATIAENTRSQEVVLAHLDEQAMDPVSDYLAQLFDPRVPGRTPFLREMVRVIWGLAKKGNAVILGRGANWFLEPRYGIRLRAVAPMDARAARIAAREGIGLDAARQLAVARDAQQADFIRQVYHRNIDDPVGYDLVLNMGNLSPETAVRATVSALRCRLSAGS